VYIRRNASRALGSHVFSIHRSGQASSQPLTLSTNTPKMLAFKLLAAAAILAQGVVSEGIHLLNCSPWGAAGSERIWHSVVAVRGPGPTPLPACLSRN
jgi:hypothetical protein